LERPRKIPHSPPKHPDIDLETGFPIIDGAICPF
jgi:hypothetical protein